MSGRFSKSSDTEKTPLVTSINKSPEYGNGDVDNHGLDEHSTEIISSSEVEVNIKPNYENKNSKTDQPPTLIFFRVSRRKKIILLLCTMANFLSSCAFALLAPFYPLEAERKGVDLPTVGFIFSVYQLVVFLSSPVYGNYMTRIGIKFLYVSGIFVGGISSILFGTLDKGPDGTVFVVMCILCRSIEALGFAAFTTTSLTIATSEFPDHIGAVYAILETGSGLGFMGGPVVGGVLYQLGGYGLPFYVIGAVILINGIMIYTFLPNPGNDQKEETKRKKSIFHLMRSPMIVFPFMSSCLAITGICMFDATFAKHIEPFHLSTSIVGLFYILGPASYTVISPLIGYLTDVKDIQVPIIVSGHLIFAFGFLFFGPSELLPFVPYSLWAIGLGFSFAGIALACLIIPCMKCAVVGAYDLGYEKNTDTFALISGLFSSVMALGGFIGPFSGAAAVEAYGYSTGYTVVAFISVFIMVVSGSYYLYRYLKAKRDVNCKDPIRSSSYNMEDGSVSRGGDCGLGDENANENDKRGDEVLEESLRRRQVRDRSLSLSKSYVESLHNMSLSLSHKKD